MAFPRVLLQEGAPPREGVLQTPRRSRQVFRSEALVCVRCADWRDPVENGDLMMEKVARLGQTEVGVFWGWPFAP